MITKLINLFNFSFNSKQHNQLQKYYDACVLNNNVDRAVYLTEYHEKLEILADLLQLQAESDKKNIETIFISTNKDYPCAFSSIFAVAKYLKPYADIEPSGQLFREHIKQIKVAPYMK